jgi:hypothetical protein
MPSGIKVSIGSLMLFIILVALQLVLFEGVWWILVSSPITIMVLTLNLAMFFLLVRPPALEPRIIGMLLGGLVACVSLMMMLISSDGPRARWATLGRRRRAGPRPTGPIGKVVDEELVRWLTSLPDQQSPTATILGFIILNINVIEDVLLDLIGVVLIWAGGWLESRLRRRCVRARAPGPSVLPPLDDRAATPL